MVPKWLQLFWYEWFSWFNHQLIDLSWNWYFSQNVCGWICHGLSQIFTLASQYFKIKLLPNVVICGGFSSVFNQVVVRNCFSWLSFVDWFFCTKTNYVKIDWLFPPFRTLNRLQLAYYVYTMPVESIVHLKIYKRNFK